MSYNMVFNVSQQYVLNRWRNKCCVVPTVPRKAWTAMSTAVLGCDFI